MVINSEIQDTMKYEYIYRTDALLLRCKKSAFALHEHCCITNNYTRELKLREKTH